MAIHRGRPDLLLECLRREPEIIHHRFAEADYLWMPFDRPGPTLLHIAVDYNELEIIELLLDHGADINARASVDAEGIGGQTPLFHACASWRGYWASNGEEVLFPGGYGFPAFRLLLERSADTRITATIRFPEQTWGDPPQGGGTFRVTPLEYVNLFQGRRYPEVIAALQQHAE
jgi:ankyrin repeat protein